LRGFRPRQKQYRAAAEPSQAPENAALFLFYTKPVDCRAAPAQFQSTFDWDGGTILRLELQTGRERTHVD
jgi:hypothetical protein